MSITKKIYIRPIKIINNIFIGSSKSLNKNILKKYKIEHVVKIGPAFLVVNNKTTVHHNNNQYINDNIKELLSKIEDTNVIISCNSGSDKSVDGIKYILINQYNMKEKNANKYIKSIHPLANI